VGSADALTNLAAAVAKGLGATTGSMRPAIEQLFGDRYQKRHLEPTSVRDAYGLADASEGGVPYAWLIHPDTPLPGPYGGT
jgi:hypothetical protein